MASTQTTAPRRPNVEAPLIVWEYVFAVERQRDAALRSAALREAETARAEEYKSQLADVTTRLIQQRRRLRELEELQAAPVVGVLQQPGEPK